MKARFALEGRHRPVIVVEPETVPERILLAAFVRYDANVFTVVVDRDPGGSVDLVTFRAEQAT